MPRRTRCAGVYCASAAEGLFHPMHGLFVSVRWVECVEKPNRELMDGTCHHRAAELSVNSC